MNKYLHDIRSVKEHTTWSIAQIRKMIADGTLPMWRINDKGKWFITDDGLRKRINELEKQII